MVVRKINLKEHVHDDTFDLSVCDLDEVPVKAIASVPRIYTLDLSHNKLRTLGTTFASSLTHLTKLDISNNLLTSLPDNFGCLVNLKHLELNKNALQTLPLSFSDLGALRWLDLTDNPLHPKIAEVVGTCNDAHTCNLAARKIVKYMREMKAILEEEKKKELERKKQEELELQLLAQKKERQREKKKKKKAQALANANKDSGGTNEALDSNDDLLFETRNIGNGHPKDIPKAASAGLDKECMSNSKNLKGGSKSSFCKSLFWTSLKLSLLAILFISFVDETCYRNMRNQVLSAANATSEFVTKHGGVHLATAKEKVIVGASIVKENVGVGFERVSNFAVDTYHWLSNDKTVQLYIQILKDYMIFFYEVMADLTLKVTNTIKESIK